MNAEPEEPDCWWRPMYKRILVALDGSERAAKILPHAVTIAQCSGATLVLFKVLNERPRVMQQAMEGGSIAGKTPIDVADEAGRVEEERMAAYFAGVQRDLKKAGVPHEVLVTEGETVEALTRFVNEQEIDLLAMVTSAKSVLGRLLHGSTTEKVLHQIHAPALLLHVDK